MKTFWRGALLGIVLITSACASLSSAQRVRSLQVAQDARSTEVDCDLPLACAETSPLRALGSRAWRESTPEAPHHYALMLDYGQDALLARVNLIRSATTSIDLQTYIFDEDDAGQLVLEELLAAARRGVHVRVLIDQLAALKRIDTLAALSGAHVNFELRLYNPVLGRALISYPQYVLASACCWRQLNQRMHSKLLLVDGMVGITGGRNYQNDYFDWDDSFNFRDRDVLVAGPVAGEMHANFEAFWASIRTHELAELTDVGHVLLSTGVPALPGKDFDQPARVERMQRDASDQALVGQHLADNAIAVSGVEFIGDLPQKHSASHEYEVAPASAGLRDLLASAQQEILLQTPYLVLSPPAQDLFRELHGRDPRPRVIISTNSLASTDAFITYALSYKYKRRYVRDFGFEIHEFKPFPADVPLDLDATGALDAGAPDPGALDPAAQGDAHIAPAAASPDLDQHAGQQPDLRTTEQSSSSPPELIRAESGQPASTAEANDTNPKLHPLSREYSARRWIRPSINEAVPLERVGLHVGLHAKSMVIDERVGVVGTHNFDPRGDRYNTESAVVISDPAFARQLAASIRRDIEPANAWTVARRDKAPIFPGLEYSLAKISERLPIFDLWPTRYATSYEFVPGPECPLPVPLTDPDFRKCYTPVGDFPEVNDSVKSLLTRIFTAFGAGLAPIL